MNRKVLIEISEFDYRVLQEAERAGRSPKPVVTVERVHMFDAEAQFAVDDYRDQHKHDGQ
jgi:hypothetical protein